jgi:hypothetical protein
MSRASTQPEKGDWQFAYTRMFIEREAPRPCSTSKNQAGSKRQPALAELSYQALNNVNYVYRIPGPPLNFGKTTPPERLFNATNLMVYKF